MKLIGTQPLETEHLILRRLEIKDYKDLELKTYNFLCALQFANTIYNFSSPKTPFNCLHLFIKSITSSCFLH